MGVAPNKRLKLTGAALEFHWCSNWLSLNP